MDSKHFVELRSVPPPTRWGVDVSLTAIGDLAARLHGHRFADAGFDYPGVPAWTGALWCDFAVLGTSVVWCLWPPEGEEMWRTNLGGEWLDDAAGIWACFTRAFRDGIDAEAVSAGFFAGTGTLQMIPERVHALGEVAHALRSRWDGSAFNLLEEAGFDATATAELLIDTIPGFQDRPECAAGVLAFDKLAHLAVAMMAARSPRPIKDLDRFPVYPDYMLPRHLRHEGVLVYSAELAEAVDNRVLIAEDSQGEHGIRWATVYAAEQLRGALAAAGSQVTTPQLDYYLWWEAVLGPRATAMGEHHRTVTKRY